VGQIYTEDQATIDRVQSSGMETGDPPAPFSYNDVYFGYPALEGTRDEDGVITSISKMTWDHVALPAGTILWNETDQIFEVTETPPPEVTPSESDTPEGTGVA